MTLKNSAIWLIFVPWPASWIWSASSTHLIRRWNDSLWTIRLMLSALFISSGYPINSRVCSQSYNLSTKARNPARSHGLSGGPCVNLLTYFEAIVKGCPNRSSSSSLAFRHPRDESMTKQHLMVSLALQMYTEGDIWVLISLAALLTRLYSNDLLKF